MVVTMAYVIAGEVGIPRLVVLGLVILGALMVCFPHFFRAIGDATDDPPVEDHPFRSLGMYRFWGVVTIAFAVYLFFNWSSP
jgi:hypothetical protein